MAWLLFPTEADAVAAELRIQSNVLAFIEQQMPERIGPDGGLIGVNAATGQPDPSAAATTAWAIPQQYQEGWALPAPEPERIAPIPAEAFLDGVGGTPAEDLTPLPEIEVVDVAMIKRARDAQGQFIADDPATPDADEAWVEVEQ